MAYGRAALLCFISLERLAHSFKAAGELLTGGLGGGFGKEVDLVKEGKVWPIP